MSDIRIEHLSKRYGEQLILDDISLVIPAKSYVALLGPSGSGKSTLLRCIAGLVAPDGGRIEPFGDLPPERRGLGMVFQSYAVWPHMSVGKNVAYRTADTAARTALDRVGLSGFYDRAPATLSGGQQQRVALARALAMAPQALLLDEPLANLDPHLRADLCDELRALQRSDERTFIHVTHDREEALGLATLLVVLRDGRIEQAGPPDEVYRSPRSAFVAEFVAGAIRLDAETVVADLRPASSGIPAEVLTCAFAGTHYICTVQINQVKTRIRLPEKPPQRLQLAAGLKWRL